MVLYGLSHLDLQHLSHVMRKPVYAICKHQRRRSAFTSAQYDQGFVIRCLDSIIPLLGIAKISRPELISVAEQTSLGLNWSETQKTDFLMMQLICKAPYLSSKGL